jgi:hypothetical protein
MIKSKSLIGGTLALALMAAVASQPARADFGITVGVGVVMGIVGYVVGQHILNGPQDAPAPLKYRPNQGDPVAMCRSQYRSYDERTGLIKLNDGTVKICPHLQ